MYSVPQGTEIEIFRKVLASLPRRSPRMSCATPLCSCMLIVVP